MDRLAAARTYLQALGVDALLVQKTDNRRYFSGFSGSAGCLVIRRNDAFLVTDGRYTAQAAKECPSSIQVVLHTGPLWRTVGECLEDCRLVGAEKNALTYEQWGELAAALPEKNLVPVKLDQLRQIKDAGEIELIDEAVRIADEAFARLLPELHAGMTELEAAAKLEYFMRVGGAEGLAFETIAASGARSALPHGQPTQKRLHAGDLFTLDFGAVYGGYCSDITRTLVIGRADCWQRSLFAAVLEAQMTALAAVRPGVPASEVDAAARQVLRRYGHEAAFGHGLGHSLGLAIHEEPRFSPLCDVILAPGLVMTVEPGAYYPGVGGVRIEDTVVVTETGCRRLTQTDKQLLEIG